MGSPLVRSARQTHLAAVDAFVNKWTACQACELHPSKHIFYRGTVPCNILFIGSFPSANDDVLGYPLVDDAGAVLNEALVSLQGLRFCFTTAVCCHSDKSLPRDSITACNPRLAEFVKLSEAKLLVLLGNNADLAGLKLINALPNVPRSVSVEHPAFYANKAPEEKLIHFKRMEATIQQAVRNIFGDRHVR